MEKYIKLALVIVCVIATVLFVTSFATKLIVIGIVISLMYASIPRRTVKRNKVISFDNVNFEAMLSTDNCYNPRLPSISLLSYNTITPSSQKYINNLAVSIVNFYQTRGLIVEFAGVTSGIKLDTLKFKKITTSKDQPIKAADITKLKIDLASELGISENDINFLDLIIGEPHTFGVLLPSERDNNVMLYNIFSDADFLATIAKGYKRIEGECVLNSLPIVLGADSNGFIHFDMTKSPHALIAGASGSGKSVCINTILTSLLMLHTPDTLHLYLADLKDGIELIDYQDLPHVKGFYEDPDDVTGMLTMLEEEMSRRNKLIRPKKSIVEYNESLRSKDNFLPFIIVVVDEFISLSSTGDAIDKLIQLSAKARASGIFLILSTQKPVKSVIDTRIKANLNTRVCFRTTDEIESRIVIDNGDAADLRGSGDGILKTSAQTTRFQGCLVTGKETAKVLRFWK